MYQEFLTAARTLAAQQSPTQGELRRAVSSAYYAMFHALCETCANCLHRAKVKNRCERAWARTYRAVNHRTAVDACKKLVNEKPNQHTRKREYNFPSKIQNFADTFITMQGHRHDADYNPSVTQYKKAQVIGHIDSAEISINKLITSPLKHREAFVSFILFKVREK